MADYLADVGRRLREARLKNRPDLDSIPKAARELELNHGIQVSEKQYGRWERGESEPRGHKRDALAAMLQIRKEEIWGEAPIAPEEELRAQLDRIEKKLDEVLRRVSERGGESEAPPASTRGPRERPPLPSPPSRRAPRKRAAGSG